MKVCVIGIGRVGLPLSLALECKGHDVVVKDTNPSAVACFETKVAPFVEDGVEDLLLGSSIRVITEYEKCDAYVITAGTPVLQHFLPDTHVIDQIVLELFESGLMKGSLLVLRSTVPVGYTIGIAEQALADYNMVLGLDYFLAYCPERIAEGFALHELSRHNQLIGTDTIYDVSFGVASQLFNWQDQTSLTFREAEFAKLATNTYRAMHFAIASYLQMQSMKHDVDFAALRPAMMKQYPRLKDLPRPGFTAGTCLRKDFAMLASPGDLAYQSYMTNEAYPRFVAEQVTYRNARVLILGVGFKDSSDDLRDSLADVLYSEVKRITGKTPAVCDLALEPWHEYKFTSGELFFVSDLQHIVSQKERFDVIIFGNPQTEFMDEILESGVLDLSDCVVNPFGDNRGTNTVQFTY